MIRILLSHGADPNVRNQSRNTPLNWAVMSGAVDAAQVLLEVRGVPRAQHPQLYLKRSHPPDRK